MLVVLFERLPLVVKRLVCGYLAPGHSYTMQMIRMEDASFVLDPTVSCRHCSLPLPENVLLKLARQLENEDFEDAEDVA